MDKTAIHKTKTHLLIPDEVLTSIDKLVGKRKRSRFITEATKKELKRIKLERVLEKAAGVWHDEDHPDLQVKGTYRWLRELRQEEDKRIKP